MEKAREFQNNIYFCFIDYSNSFDSGWDWGQEEKGTTEDEMADSMDMSLS